MATWTAARRRAQSLRMKGNQFGKLQRRRKKVVHKDVSDINGAGEMFVAGLAGLVREIIDARLRELLMGGLHGKEG